MTSSNRRERRRYHRTNLALVALVAVYLMIAISRKAAKADDWFPITSWALFSTVPNEHRDYALQLLEVDGKKLDPPVLFEHADGMFYSARHSTARGMIQAIGTAL